MHSRGVFLVGANSCMNNSIPYYNTRISRESIVKRIKRYADILLRGLRAERPDWKWRPRSRTCVVPRAPAARSASSSQYRPVDTRGSPLRMAKVRRHRCARRHRKTTEEARTKMNGKMKRLLQKMERPYEDETHEEELTLLYGADRLGTGFRAARTRCRRTRRRRTRGVEMKLLMSHPSNKAPTAPSYFEVGDKVGLFVSEDGKPLEVGGNGEQQRGVDIQRQRVDGCQTLYWDRGFAQCLCLPPIHRQGEQHRGPTIQRQPRPKNGKDGNGARRLQGESTRSLPPARA